MRSFVSPKYVFERQPNRLDATLRLGKQAVAIARALASKEGTETRAMNRMFESDENLRGVGYGFTEHWRAILGDRLNGGVRLRTTELPYQIDATISKDDDLPRIPGVDSQYETTLEAKITQTNGYATRLRMESRTRHPSAETTYPEGVIPVVFQPQVLPLRSDGRVNTDGWGMYTHDEEAELNEVAIRVMQELNEAYEIPGALEITDL